MPVFTYTIDGGFKGDSEFPTRDSIIKGDVITLYEEEKYIVFHPIDVVETMCDIMGSKSNMILSSTLLNGERMNIAVINIEQFIHVHIHITGMFPNEEELTLDAIKRILREDNIDIKEITFELDTKFSAKGYSSKANQYYLLKFTNGFVRSNAIRALQRAGKEVLSDVSKSRFAYLCTNVKSISTWCFIKNFRKISNTMYAVDHSNFENISMPFRDDQQITEKIEFFRNLIPSNPSILCFTYDLECYSSTGAFPKPSVVEDVMFMIGGGIHRMNEQDHILSYCITCSDIDWDQDTDEGIDTSTYYLIKCPTEKDLVMAFASLMSRFQPEFRLAFNNYCFDTPYYCGRALMFGLFEQVINATTTIPLRYVNRTYHHTKYYKDVHVKMEAGRDQTIKTLYIPGSIDIDMMAIMKKNNVTDEFLESQALRSYLKRYNLPNKLDVSAEEMFEIYEQKDAVRMKRVADYCTIDGLSCQRLQAVQGTIQYNFSLGHLSFCSISDCVFRAGGMKVQNLITYMGTMMGFVYSHVAPPSTNTSYPGAYVYKPVKGIYKSAPVVATDFASLYPSIMCALNLSSETIIYDSKIATKLRSEGYDVFTFDIKYGVTCKSVHFVRKYPDGEPYKGVYVKCLEILGRLRKYYKGEMSKASNKEFDTGDKKYAMEVREYNSKQNAVKVLMNTFYGLLAFDKFAGYNVDIASTITLFGQQCLKISADVATQKGFTVLYGDTDSVFLEPTNALKANKVELSGDITNMLYSSIQITNELLVYINDAINAHSRSTKIVMAFDKLIYPTVLLGKKMYYGDIWDHDNLAKKPKRYISGMSSKKRGKTQFLKDVANTIMDRSLDLSHNISLHDIVKQELTTAIDNIKSMPISAFVRIAKYQHGKCSFVNSFITRMQCEYDRAIMFNDKTLADLYNIPRPGTNFEYVVCLPIDPYDSLGRIRKTNTAEKMEFIEVMKTFNKELDFEYYLEDISGIMARFINWEINDDDDISDLKATANAKTYLVKFIRSHRDVYAKASVIKNMRIVVYHKYVGKLGILLTDEFVTMFNNNVYPDINVAEYIISKIYEMPNTNYSKPDEYSKEQCKIEVEELTRKILKKNKALTTLYQWYVNDMREVSKQKDTYNLTITNTTIDNTKIIIDLLSEITKKIALLQIGNESSYVSDIIDTYI